MLHVQTLTGHSGYYLCGWRLCMSRLTTRLVDNSAVVGAGYIRGTAVIE
jgi:hypothetical protein